MTKNELAILDGFLDRLADVMSAAGCNDFTLPGTEENMQLVASADPEGMVKVNSRGEICTADFIVLDELRKRLRESDCSHNQGVK